MKVVRLHYVAIVLGTRQDDDRNSPQVGIGLDLREYFPAIDGREIEIEQDEVGTLGIPERSFPTEQRKPLFAVLGNRQVLPDAGIGEGLARELDVAGLSSTIRISIGGPTSVVVIAYGSPLSVTAGRVK